MERPQWLKEEATKGGSFWRRQYEVAVEFDDACSEALLAMLERQLAEDETNRGPAPLQ